MSNFKEIIDYLKVFRRSEEAAAKETHLAAMVIDKDFINGQLPHEDDYIFVKKEDIYQQNSYVSVSEQMESETLYLQEQPDGELYYYTQKEVLVNNIPTNLFKRIPFYTTDEGWIPLDENTLIAKSSEAIGNFYYDQVKGKIIEVSLESVHVFPDYFIYHPEALKADNGQYEFDYKDHEGNTASAYDRLFKLSKQLKTDRVHRKVIFQKSIQPCFVSLLPRIKVSHSGKYYLQYVRYEKGISFNGFLGESVMTLEFNYFGSLLKFLNATVFYGLDSMDAFNSKNREAFFDDYIDLVDNLIYKAKNNEALEILYYIPAFFYSNLDLNFLWNLLDNTLDGNVTNFGLDTEDIVINILEGLAESYEDKNIFLSELINKQSKSNKSILHQLIYRVDGENFKKMTSFLWKIWKESGFSEVDPKINKIITENSPVFLDYRSDKTMGFHHDNATINWNAKTNTIDVKTTKGTGVFETNTVDNGRGGSTTETTEITETFEYSYHPFSPMVIFNADNPTFIFNDEEQNDKPYQFLPAFVLYAKDESAFWENWVTAGEYAVDVLTTLSGVGNILKFGRLYKVLQAGKKLTDSSRIFTKVVTGVKGVAGMAEISSGSMNILLKLTGVADTELGREISKYLFWFEMMALSGELSVALYSKTQASASKILAKEKVLIESATNADEAKQIGKLVEELRILTDIKGKSAYWKKISDKIVFKVPKREVFQPTKNLESLYHQAKEAHKELAERTKEFAQNTSGKAGFREGLKSRERALEKINADYNGDASKLLDIAGSKVVYNSVDELYDALKLFDDNFEILKIKDRIQNPLNGYRDILMNIKMKNGHIVEFRLHLKEMDEIAEGIGHKLYEEYRTLEALSKTRNLTDNEVKRMLYLDREQKRVYDEAWNKIINK